MKKKNSMFFNLLIIAFVIWMIVLIKQQLNISQYKNDVKTLSQKIEVSEENLQQDKQYLEEEKQNTNSLEYI